MRPSEWLLIHAIGLAVLILIPPTSWALLKICGAVARALLDRTLDRTPSHNVLPTARRQSVAKKVWTELTLALSGGPWRQHHSATLYAVVGNASLKPCALCTPASD